MRLIDADKLKKDVARLHALNDENEIRRAYAFNPHSTATDFEETLVSVFDAIDEAPSIDIVQCKDCKHNPKYTGDYMYGSCLYCCEDDRYSGTPSDDFFCGRGER